jgi:sortase A
MSLQSSLSMKKFSKILSVVFILVGFILVLSSSFPILSYEIFSPHDLQEDKLLSPLPDEQKNDFSKLPRGEDLIKASNWFEGSPPDLAGAAPSLTYYNLSIPKLKIKNATVEVAGEDLSKNLIQYKGTALPGEKGNTVIFGHSTLPQLFKPDNYLSIFSTLPTIKKGEKILVSYDGITYTYKIEDIFEVKPTQVEILNQKFDDSYISIVTCVPPGTYLKRLVVRGRLVPPGTP